MGGLVPELDWSRPILHTSRPVMAATVFTTLTLVLLLVFPTSPLPVKRAADAMSLAEGNAEPISAMNGFYGNPLYRPYGFSSWGFGSSGYMRNSVVVAGPNINGGYHFSG